MSALKRLRVFIHNGLQRVVEGAGIKAAAETRHEPTGTALMRGRYTGADCRALFPASRKKTVVEKAAELSKELDQALDRRGDEGHMEAVLVVRRNLTEFSEVVFNTARGSGKTVDKHVACKREYLFTLL
jgi:hypothetical protein